MDKSLNVVLQAILLEDNPADAELMQLELSRAGIEAEYRLVATKAEFVKAIGQTVPDVVLADYSLPGFDGLSALRLLRARTPDVPFIFVSGSLGEERAIEALKSGATDYVLKERLQRLPAVVRRALTEAHERRERRHAQTALEEQRELLAALINNLPEYIYAVDSVQKLTVINRAMLDRLGLPLDGALGRRFSDIVSPATAQELENADARVLSSGKQLVDQEHAVGMGDGGLQWLISSRVPLRDHHTGAIAGVICTERDITARKEMEREILEISNREQRRLGSDLHDGLGQELTGLSLMMKGLEMQLSREAPQYLPQAAKISELLAHTIQSTRSLARGLAPVNLERGGLREALRHLAIRCSDMYQLSCNFDDRRAQASALDESLAIHLYRVAQEATTNAARHAQAKHIRIELRTSTTRLHLSITDDGVGLAAGLKAGKQPGMGLKTMEYRARVLGGSIDFQTLSPGTRIVLSCPLQLLQGRKQLPRTA
jgi:PAS domain S-box-containing protein